jgi:hypothetical protein
MADSYAIIGGGGGSNSTYSSTHMVRHYEMSDYEHPKYRIKRHSLRYPEAKVLDMWTATIG